VKKISISRRKSVEYRPLGKTGLAVSSVGFGAARFAETYYEGSEREMIALLQATRDAGVTFYDTAGMYSQGRSERILGTAFGSDSHELVIASKAGYTVSGKQKLLARVKPVVVPVLKRMGLRPARKPAGTERPVLPTDYSPRAIRAGLEASLSRLRRDHLALFFLHGVPPHDRLPESLDCLAALKREGKILHYGASCESLDDAFACLGSPGIEVIQVTLSLVEPQTLPFIREARKLSIGIVARQCYAAGWLTRSRDVLEREAPSMVRRIETFRAVATRHGRSLPELAFRFVHDCPGVDVTLIGVRTRKHLDDAIAFASRPELSDVERAELAALGIGQEDLRTGPHTG
jgi:aryl-alcohol dehydrogenase-like predicted oxidoreductase